MSYNCFFLILKKFLPPTKYELSFKIDIDFELGNLKIIKKNCYIIIFNLIFGKLSKMCLKPNGFNSQIDIKSSSVTSKK